MSKNTVHLKQQRVYRKARRGKFIPATVKYDEQMLDMFILTNIAHGAFANGGQKVIERLAESVNLISEVQSFMEKPASEEEDEEWCALCVRMADELNAKAQ